MVILWSIVRLALEILGLLLMLDLFLDVSLTSPPSTWKIPPGMFLSPFSLSTSVGHPGLTRTRRLKRRESSKILNNKVRTAIDNRLPQHEILQQATTAHIIVSSVKPYRTLYLHQYWQVLLPGEGTIGEHCRTCQDLIYRRLFSRWLSMIPGMKSKIQYLAKCSITIPFAKPLGVEY